MNISFHPDLGEDGTLASFLDGQALADTPEERLRQRCLKILHYEYGYAKNQMRAEDRARHTDRADIAIYETKSACAKRDESKILLLADCSAPTAEAGRSRLALCLSRTGASGGVWFGGSGGDNDSADGIAYFRRLPEASHTLVEWPGIPRRDESWDTIGRRKKSELKRPPDVKELLRRCHNRLHARGSEEDDLAMEMVRIILAKAEDEGAETEQPQFYCTPEEYASGEGRRQVDRRIGELFERVKRRNPGVFDEHERIAVGPRPLCDVVSVLQDYRLLSDENGTGDWDLMGSAYEEYTEDELKRRKGQFFTNRLVAEFLVQAVDPNEEDLVLDPAGGSGGFLTCVLRRVRRSVLLGPGDPDAKQLRLRQFLGRLFLVESSKRLVKVARTAMILNGGSDSQAGITQGDSLGGYDGFDPAIRAKAGRGAPTVILTNPPFAGVGSGRITERSTLARFTCLESAVDGAPPELLFLERCMDWLAPGGRLGIVMPKGFLDTNTYLRARQYLFRHCRLLAVVNLHKNTFQPHTGVRTCLLVMQKYGPGEGAVDDYDIFMGISRRIGQDSEGRSVYRIDDAGRRTDEPDHDLDEILRRYEEFRKGVLKPSSYCFSVRRSELNEALNINPQQHMPGLNATIDEVVRMGETEGWKVETLGQLARGIRIFKGHRLKTQHLVTEDRDRESVEPYYTPSAILQEKSDSIKYLNLSRADRKQLSDIRMIRVRRGDLLITRSGSIGRVAYVTSRHDNAIVSDDLIRVVIPDEALRFYVYVYLQSRLAQDQFKRNEYGSVQQHLEPSHVRGLLVPVPDDAGVLEPIVRAAKAEIQAKEKVVGKQDLAMKRLGDLLGK